MGIFLLITTILFFIAGSYKWFFIIKPSSDKTISNTFQQFLDFPLLNTSALFALIFILFPISSNFYESFIKKETTNTFQNILTDIHYIKAKHPNVLSDINLTYQEQNIT